MNIQHLTLHLLAVVLSLATATGVIIHDSRFEKALDGHLSWRVDSQSMKYDSSVHPNLHVHSEQTNPGSSRGSQNQNSNPSYPPREQRLKKYLTQNIEPRGRHAFDSYHLPVIG